MFSLPLPLCHLLHLHFLLLIWLPPLLLLLRSEHLSPELLDQSPTFSPFLLRDPCHLDSVLQPEIKLWTIHLAVHSKAFGEYSGWLTGPPWSGCPPFPQPLSYCSLTSYLRLVSYARSVSQALVGLHAFVAAIPFPGKTHPPLIDNPSTLTSRLGHLCETLLSVHKQWGCHFWAAGIPSALLYPNVNSLITVVCSQVSLLYKLWLGPPVLSCPVLSYSVLVHGTPIPLHSVLFHFIPFKVRWLWDNTRKVLRIVLVTEQALN